MVSQPETTCRPCAFFPFKFIIRLIPTLKYSTRAVLANIYGDQVSVDMENGLQSWCIMQVASQHELLLQSRARRTFATLSLCCFFVAAFACAGC